MRVNRSLDMVHPLLRADVATTQKLITKHRLPFRLFETGRDRDRQQFLMQSGKVKVPNTGHMYNLENDPPLYTTAIAFVMNNNSSWSWNLRDATTAAWYALFGQLVLDVCPNLDWGGLNRKATDYTLFTLKKQVIFDNLFQYPCVLPV